MTLLASVVSRGVVASRPAAGITGQLYYATDVSGGQLQRDNGTTWDNVEGAPTSPAVSAKTASYTVLATDNNATLIANAASLVFTLPAPATAGSGFWIRVKNNNQTTTGIKTNATGVLLDGVDSSATAYTTGLTVAYGVVRVQTDGTAWYTV